MFEVKPDGEFFALYWRQADGDFRHVVTLVSAAVGGMRPLCDEHYAECPCPGAIQLDGSDE